MDKEMSLSVTIDVLLQNVVKEYGLSAREVSLVSVNYQCVCTQIHKSTIWASGLFHFSQK